MRLQGMVCWGKSRAGGKGLSLMGVGMMPEEWKAWRIFPLILVQDKKCREIRNTQIAKPRQPGESFPWAVVKYPSGASLAFSLKTTPVSTQPSPLLSKN